MIRSNIINRTLYDNSRRGVTRNINQIISYQDRKVSFGPNIDIFNFLLSNEESISANTYDKCKEHTSKDIQTILEDIFVKTNVSFIEHKYILREGIDRNNIAYQLLALFNNNLGFDENSIRELLLVFLKKSINSGNTQATKELLTKFVDKNNTIYQSLKLAIIDTIKYCIKISLTTPELKIQTLAKDLTILLIDKIDVVKSKEEGELFTMLLNSLFSNHDFSFSKGFPDKYRLDLLCIIKEVNDELTKKSSNSTYTFVSSHPKMLKNVVNQFIENIKGLYSNKPINMRNLHQAHDKLILLGKYTSLIDQKLYKDLIIEFKSTCENLYRASNNIKMLELAKDLFKNVNTNDEEITEAKKEITFKFEKAQIDQMDIPQREKIIRKTIIENKDNPSAIRQKLISIQDLIEEYQDKSLTSQEFVTKVNNLKLQDPIVKQLLEPRSNTAYKLKSNNKKAEHIIQIVKKTIEIFNSSQQTSYRVPKKALFNMANNEDL